MDYKLLLLKIKFVPVVIAGALVFVGVVLYTSSADTRPQISPDMLFPLLGIIAVLLPLAYYSSYKEAKRYISDLAPDADLTRKLQVFYAAHVLRLAPLAGLGLFSCVSFKVTHQPVFLYIAAVFAIWILSRAFSMRRMIEELSLNRRELDELHIS